MSADPPPGRRPRPKKRKKRSRRSDRNNVQRLSRRRWLQRLVTWPRLAALAENLPLYEEGQNGRPPDFPPVVLLVYGICARKWKSHDHAEAELADDQNWQVVLDAFAPDYPHYNLRAGHPVTYQHWARFRAKFAFGEPQMAQFKEDFEQVAADQALDMGLLSPTGGGSVTRMHRTRVVSGDGVVLQSLYNTSPEDRFVDRDTGEVWSPRADPDARRYPKKAPDRAGPAKPRRPHSHSDEVIVGVKWVTTHVNTGHELERVTLTVDHEPHRAPGGEAAIAVAALKRIKGRCPAMLGASWDKALRGTHINDLYHARIQPVVKVFLDKRQPKKRRIGTYPVTDPHTGTTLGDIELWGDGGKPCLYRRLQGQDHFVPLIKKQIKYRTNNGRPAALYQCAAVPEDPRVPAHLRCGLVWFRHDNDGPEQDPDLNRAEVLRTVCETDQDEWRDLYYDRPGSESDNARDQNNLANRRAPSLGAPSQQIDLICLEMANHLDAEHAYQTRTTAAEANAPPPKPIPRAA